jgi:hypothetical protein
MKELLELIRSGIMACATAYPLATFVVLGLGPLVIAALSRNVVGLAIVACGAIAGFSVGYLIGAPVGPLFIVWGVLWLIAFLFLMLGRPQSRVITAND